MVGQQKRLSQPLRWTKAGRIAVILVGASLSLAALGLALGSIFATSQSKPGCINVTFASALGAAEIHPCGQQARQLCASPSLNPAAAAHGALRQACARAGLPYGDRSSTR